jgi:ubiquinol-cytochrome c reductase cytochrome b subunit
VLLLVQVFRGVLLVLHYTPDSELAFDRVQYICREVDGGWIVRVVHFNGASMLFMAIYLHILKGLFLSSYRLKAV